MYRGTNVLCTLLTRLKVNSSLTTVLKTYKRILELTSGHVGKNEISNNIKTKRGKKFKKSILQIISRH